MSAAPHEGRRQDAEGEAGMKRSRGRPKGSKDKVPRRRRCDSPSHTVVRLVRPPLSPSSAPLAMPLPHRSLPPIRRRCRRHCAPPDSGQRRRPEPSQASRAACPGGRGGNGMDGAMRQWAPGMWAPGLPPAQRSSACSAPSTIVRVRIRAGDVGARRSRSTSPTPYLPCAWPSHFPFP